MKGKEKEKRGFGDGVTGNMKSSDGNWEMKDQASLVRGLGYVMVRLVYESIRYDTFFQLRLNHRVPPEPA